MRGVAGVVVGFGCSRLVGLAGGGGVVRLVRLVGLAGGGHRVLEGAGGVEVVDDVRVADRPVDLAAVVAPRRELAADLGELAGGDGRVFGVADVDRGDLAADERDGDRVEVVVDAGERLVAARGHGDEGRGGWGGGPRRARAHHAHVLLAVGAVPAERDEAVARVVGEDAVGAGCEVVVAVARRGDDGGGAPRGRDPDEVVGAAGDAPDQGLVVGAAGTAHRDDAVAVGRPDGGVVEGGGGGEAGGVAAVCVDAVDVATGGVVPGGVGDVLAVGRPGGHVLVGLRLGEPFGRPAGPVHDVHAGEQREGDAVAAWRRHRVPHLLGDKGLGVFDAVVEIDLRADRHVDIDAEGDGRGVGAVDGDAPQAAAVVGDYGIRVRREGHAGIGVARGAGLLVVALHGEGEPALVTGVEIADAQARVGDVAGAVDQPAPVGAEGGAEGAAVAERAGGRLAGLAIVDGQLVLAHAGVVFPAAGAVGVPDGASVRAEGGPGGAAVGGLVDELDSGAAVDVVEPELALSGRLFGGDHVVTVGGPLGRLVGARLALRDLDRVALVQRDDVDPFTAAAVGGEDDAGAVGAEPRLPVEGHAPGERRGGAPGDRQGVEVAEEVEDQCLAVGTDVDRHPRAFGEAGGDGAPGGEGETLLLGVGVVFVRVLGQEGVGRQGVGREGEGGCQEQTNAPLHGCEPQSSPGNSLDVVCARAAPISLHRSSSNP